MLLTAALLSNTIDGFFDTWDFPRVGKVVVIFSDAVSERGSFTSPYKQWYE